MRLGDRVRGRGRDVLWKNKTSNFFVSEEFEQSGM